MVSYIKSHFFNDEKEEDAVYIKNKKGFMLINNEVDNKEDWQSHFYKQRK